MSSVLFSYNFPIFKKHVGFSTSPECAKRMDIIEKAMLSTQKLGLISPYKLKLDTKNQLSLLELIHPIKHIDEIKKADKFQTALYPISAISETLDVVLAEDSPYHCAFCAIRPPGHHSYKNGL